MTNLVDVNPGLAVAPFWEHVDPNNGEALMTPLEVMQLLHSRGYNISYRRIPLSRERTPEAADMDVLHRIFTEANQIPTVGPRGGERTPGGGSPRASMAGGSPGGSVHGGSAPGGRTVYLLLSRTPVSSSPRFVAAVACTFIMKGERTRVSTYVSVDPRA